MTTNEPPTEPTDTGDEQYPSYQSYPSYESYPPGAPPQAPLSGPIEQPQSIRTAVILMYAGAAVSLISLIAQFFTRHTLRATVASSMRKSTPNATHDQIIAAYHAILVVALIAALIGIGLWLWMAWKNGQGRSWARIVGTVLGALEVVGFLFSLSQPEDALSRIVQVILVAIAVITVILMWRRESTEFYQANRPTLR